MVYSFTSSFLRQLVTQSSIAAAFAWKTVASCPSEMCHCMLWYSRIPIPVPYRLQAPSVNQTCPFFGIHQLCVGNSSPDLSPPDFNLFLKLKELLRGARFRWLNELLLAIAREIRYLDNEQLLNGIQKLSDCWQACIEQGGDYIRGL